MSISLDHDATGAVLRLGEIPEAEGQLIHDVVAAFLDARARRIATGLSGAEIVRVDEAKNWPAWPAVVSTSIEAKVPRRS